MAESYSVNFWIKKKDGNWTTMTKVYPGKNKHSHDRVQKEWAKEHMDHETRLISIVYQQEE